MKRIETLEIIADMATRGAYVAPVAGLLSAPWLGLLALVSGFWGACCLMLLAGVAADNARNLREARNEWLRNFTPDPGGKSGHLHQ